MKNKKKKLVFFLVLFLSIGFFGFGDDIALAAEDALIVTEVMHDPMENKEGKKVEWVEMYANFDKKFTLKTNGQIESFYLCAKKGDVENSCKNAYVAYATTEVLELKKGDLIIFTKDPEIFKNTYDDYGAAKIIKTSSSFNLLESSDAYIAYSDDNKLSWYGDVSYSEYFDKKQTGYSLEKIAFKKDNAKSNWQESFVKGGTPGEASSKKPAPKIYSTGVALNEILPNPSGDGEEYIEILNNSAEEVDLEGWILRDGSKTGKYVFADNLILKSGSFLAVYKKDFKFALNDSGTESVHLLDPSEKEVSVVTYSGAKDGLSHGLDGSKWRWSKHLTPGAENAFDSAPNFKVIKDDTVYKNFPANFDVNIKKYKKSKYKITWNFGDGHKSYKKTTTHKYDKNGKYYASVKIFNGSEEVIKEFKVEVKSFPKYDVEIIAVNPNPEGSDTNLETLTVRNNSKKKVNLQNWSIATGDKKLTNHPIALKAVLKPKETLQITRALSKFTLNNKKANVELRYPTGKVASKMAYDKKTETIAEGEIIEKSKLGWAWKNTALPAEALAKEGETSLLAIASEIEQNLETPQILGESAVKADVPLVEHSVGERMIEGGQSVAKNKKDFKIVLASFIYGPFTVHDEIHR